jgi:hypothetical protein
VLRAVLPGHLRPSMRKGNALLMSRETLSFGTSTLPLLHPLLHLCTFRSWYVPSTYTVALLGRRPGVSPLAVEVACIIHEAPMTNAELLFNPLGRIRGVAHWVVDGLTAEQPACRVNPEGNSIAWMVWHLT